MGTEKCRVCGTESLVTVVSQGHQGALRQFCSECDRRRAWSERRGVRAIEGGSARLLIYAGVILTLLTLTVDRLSIRGHSGFGWRQITGAEVGFLCLVIGILVGEGFLGMAGLFLLVVSLGADILELGRAPGLGWRKQTALALSSLLLAGGMLWQRVLKKRETSPSPSGNEGAQP
jgi:hypothetical protein